MTKAIPTAPQDLNIAATASTPAMQCIWEQGIVRLRGEAYPEDTHAAFQPLLEWLERYLAHPGPRLRLETELSYLNTSSIKVMMDILDLLEQAHQNGCEISMEWCYEAENERALEVAEEFREDVSFPFATRML